MKTSKVLALIGVLAVIAAFVVYAVNTTKGTKPGMASKDPAAQAPVPPPAPPPTASGTPTSSGPKIQFASLVYDFGKANGDDLVNCVFYFTNVGNSLLEISNVSPACGCMKIGQWSRSAEPGQTGSIAVQYDSHHYTGFFAKSVFVSCNDTSQPNPMLEIKGTVWRPIEVTPPSAVLNLTSETPSNATTVRVISHLEQPLILSDLACANRAFTVELQTNQPDKEYQLLIKTAPPFPTNNQQGQITLKTSATNMPVINLNVWANVQPIVMAIPYFIRVPAPPLTNSFATTVWIRNNGTNALTLSEPSVNAKGVDAQIKEDQAGVQFTVTLSFPAGFEMASGEKVELSVKSNHPLFPVVKVPVMQPPRPSPESVPSPRPPSQPAPLAQPVGR